MKAKTKLTRLWSILLTLVLLVGLLPTVALAEGPATGTADFTTDPTAPLALLNTAKTDGAADSEWNNTTKTLTLNGVNFETTALDAVKLPDGATIVLNGENTIKGGSGSGDCYGIYGEGSLTIQGTGTLDVTSGTSTSNLSFGIHAQGSVTINSGAVTATGGAALNGQNGQRFGIRALNNALTITGGTVTATGGDAKISSNGLWAGDGSVTISGGTVVAESGRVTGVGASSGIYAKNVEINNTGTIVTATSGTAQRGTSYGINAVSGGTVTFSGGTLTAATKGDSCIKGTFNAAGKTISFDSNDGVGNMMARTTAAEYTLPANGFTAPEGKQFKGWAESANGDVISGTSITVTGNTTLYAIWEDIPATYTVTWKSQDGSDTLETDTGVAYNAAPSFGGAAPTKADDDQYTYTFAGWATSENQESGTAVGNLPVVTGNVIYYAAFSKTAKSYAVTLNTNGATSCDALTTYTFGTGATLPTPTKTGYTFGGWYDNSSFTGEAVTVIAADATGAKTFYAKWNAISSGGIYIPPTYKV